MLCPKKIQCRDVGDLTEEPVPLPEVGALMGSSLATWDSQPRRAALHAQPEESTARAPVEDFLPAESTLQRLLGARPCLGRSSYLPREILPLHGFKTLSNANLCRVMHIRQW